jgi:hypothetical protein
MGKSSPLGLSILMVAFTVLALEKSAFAYIDLGTGSMLFQVVVASIVGGLAAIKLGWHRIKQILTGRRDDQTSSKPHNGSTSDL